jgi:beta-glucosidase
MMHEGRIDDLLARMTLAEKVGQMAQLSGTHEAFEGLIRRGAVGSFLNVVGEQARKYQRLAVEGSRLGIPLIFGRDVIHGFRTIFPIPLGQAASFDPEIVREGARIAASEAAASGVHWTFGPMVDIARDPRWGRIAEGCGEDPYLAACLGAAMVQGFQGEDLADPHHIAACAKHYVGYGAAEGGRDYDTTWVPEGLLRDVYLVPFAACVRAGVATLMSAFNDLNGVPASGNAFTLRKVLKGEWGFDGFVVSDWASICELIPHGFAADEREAALRGVAAGVDMEMVTTAYTKHLEALVADGVLPVELIDEAVRRILRIKLRLGLFDDPYRRGPGEDLLLAEEHLAAARQAARESCVLLKNDGLLPLSEGIGRLAVVGPLADAGRDQLGCWAMDGRSDDSCTPLAALRMALGAERVAYAPGLAGCRTADGSGIAAAVAAAREADAVLAFVGEDAGMSGEAHNRAFLDLPGAQQRLVDALAEAGKPLAAVVMAGRSLTLGPVLEKVGALLLTWHPGTMGGPAIADLLFGLESPSGRLPVSLPRTVGQVPIYYNRKNTGRPPRDDAPAIPTGTPLDPVGFTTSYLDVDHRPLFPFGYGLSYTTFEYAGLQLSTTQVRLGEALTAAATLTNTGPVHAVEVVQIYVRDLVGSVTRPVRELKGFQRVALEPGESRQVQFTLHTADLAFHNADMQRVTEPGRFHLWIGPDAQSGLQGEFEVLGSRS